MFCRGFQKILVLALILFFSFSSRFVFSADFEIILQPANYAKLLKKSIKAQRSRVITERLKAPVSGVLKVGAVRYDADFSLTGDLVDHIASDRGIFSLKIKLLRGNIRGVSAFKLLLRKTRPPESIPLTLALRDHGVLDFGASTVQVVMNGVYYEAFFFEMPSRSFLENRGRAEGPIFRADERLWWEAALRRIQKEHPFKYPAFGYFRLANASYLDPKEGDPQDKFGLNPERHRLVRELLEHILSAAYHYDFGRSFFCKVSNSCKFYDLLRGIAPHALLPNNLILYYDPLLLENEFVFWDPDYQLGACSSAELSSIELLECVRRELQLAVKEKLDSPVALDAPNSSIKLPRSLPRQNIVFFNEEIDKYVRCENVVPFETSFSYEDCAIVPDKNAKKILAGAYTYMGQSYVYGFQREKFPLLSNVKIKCVKRDCQVSYLGTVKLDGSSLNSNMIYHLSPETPDSMIIISGLLPDGADFYMDSKHTAKRASVGGITGCLTFYHTRFTNNSITIRSCPMEDALHIVSSQGLVKNIDINGSKSDALDVDNSHVNFATIMANDAGNDCVDFSGGHASIRRLNVSNCGDKGLSFGEATKVELVSGAVARTHIGIALKDSSTLSIDEKIDISESNDCFLSYQKKKQFSRDRLLTGAINCR